MQEVLFSALFPDYTPPEGFLEAFAALRVTHAELDRERRRIHLEAASEQYIPQSVLQEAAQALKKRYALASMELLARFPEQALSSLDPKDLAQVFIRAYSPAAGILAGAEWTVGEEEIFIHLRANGKKLLEEHVPKVQQYLLDRFGAKRGVRIEAGTALEGRALFEQTARLRAEAIKIAPQAAPAAICRQSIQATSPGPCAEPPMKARMTTVSI